MLTGSRKYGDRPTPSMTPARLKWRAHAKPLLYSISHNYADQFELRNKNE